MLGGSSRTMLWPSIIKRCVMASTSVTRRLYCITMCLRSAIYWRPFRDECRVLIFQKTNIVDEMGNGIASVVCWFASPVGIVKNKCSWCHCKKKYSSGFGKNESQNGNSRNVFVIIRNSFGHVGSIWAQYGLISCLLGIMYRSMLQTYIENSYNV